MSGGNIALLPLYNLNVVNTQAPRKSFVCNEMTTVI